jgi:subtilisin family serine protease
MDPGLEEAILRTPAHVSVEAVAVLRPGFTPPEALRVVTRFGPIVTCRIPAGMIRAVRAHPAVFSLKATRVVEPNAVTAAAGFPARPQLGAEPRQPLGDSTQQSNVVLGILDWGCDVAHPALRLPNGRTRLLAIWDQRSRGTIGRRAEPYGYGRILTRDQIDRALATIDPYAQLEYNPVDADHTGHGSHGTHVLSVAAGSTAAPPGAVGIAPGVDLVFVHLASGLLPEQGTLGESSRVLEGVDLVRRIARRRAWVINMSLGRTGGSHSGRSPLELALDFTLEEAPGRAIVQSGGNYFDKRIAAHGRVYPGRLATLAWHVNQDDPTTNELEVFYSGRDTFALELVPPASGESIRVELGEHRTIEFGGRAIGRAYHREHEPLTGDHHIDVFLEPEAPAGTWQVRLVSRDVVDGRFHAWIERDSAVAGSQSRFESEDASPRSTIGTIATGYRTIVVGAADTTGPISIASFSSSGPTRDGRVKPDLLAPGVGIPGARSTPFGAEPGSGGITFYSGSSMAAPHVSGTIAALFAASPRKLTIGETRALILGNAKWMDHFDPERAGSGLLDMQASIDSLTALTERKTDMNPSSIVDLVNAALAGAPAPARRLFQSALQAVASKLPSDLVVVAGPGETLRDGVQPSDIVVRVNPGEPVPALVGEVTSSAEWLIDAGAQDAEEAGPGYYAGVGPYGQGPASWRKRQILDRSRRMRANHLLLRRRVQTTTPPWLTPPNQWSGADDSPQAWEPQAPGEPDEPDEPADEPTDLAR